MPAITPLAFTASPLDRAGHLRGDVGRLFADPKARILPLWRGKPLMDAGGNLVWLRPGDPLLELMAEAPVFLGLAGEVAHFAADVSSWPGLADEPLPGFFDPNRTHHPDLTEGHDFADLRSMIAVLSAEESAIAATAKGVLAWHDSHRFCARCGERSAMAMAGWQRSCTACGTSHFPRTDPVVIMLITHGNSTLLGRGSAWPEGMYSCLAGFMEPGETIEAAVRRETLEETAVQVGAVTYKTSQPWPFPASLMIGCHGLAETTDITLDPAELEAALWVSRENLLHALAGFDADVKPARKGSIARFLMESWVSGAWT